MPRKTPSKSISKKVSSKQLDTLWSKKVRELFGHKCAVCGASPVQAHHIFTRSYKSTRWNLDNGIALCYRHHFYLEHSKFEEFRDFVINYLGEDKYNEIKELSKQIVKPDLEEIKTSLEKSS